MSDIFYAENQYSEYWDCDDLDTLFDQMFQDGSEFRENVVLRVFCGELVIHPASHYLPNISDMLVTTAEQCVGDVSENWRIPHRELLQRCVSDAVDTFITAHGVAPVFGEIVNIKKVAVRILKINGRGMVNKYERV